MTFNNQLTLITVAACLVAVSRCAEADAPEESELPPLPIMGGFTPTDLQQCADIYFRLRINPAMLATFYTPADCFTQVVNGTNFNFQLKPRSASGAAVCTIQVYRDHQNNKLEITEPTRDPSAVNCFKVLPIRSPFYTAK